MDRGLLSLLGDCLSTPVPALLHGPVTFVLPMPMQVYAQLFFRRHISRILQPAERLQLIFQIDEGRLRHPQSLLEGDL